MCLLVSAASCMLGMFGTTLVLNDISLTEILRLKFAWVLFSKFQGILIWLRKFNVYLSLSLSLSLSLYILYIYIYIYTLPIRPISLLTLSLLTLLESKFPGNPLRAWEFHPLELRLCLSPTPWNPHNVSREIGRKKLWTSGSPWWRSAATGPPDEASSVRRV